MTITKEFIKENLKWIQIQEEQSQLVVSELKDKSKQIENNCERAVRHVSLFASELIAAINRSKKNLFQDIETLKNTLLDKVNNARTTQELRVKDIQKTREKLNTLLKTLSGTDEMVHELLTKSHVQLQNKPVDPTIRFFPNEEQTLSKCLDIGNVYIIEEADCSQSFIEAIHTKCEVLSAVHLYLRTNTSVGKPCIVSDRCIEVNILPKSYADKLTVVESSTVGKMDISFLPTISGKFVVKVKIDGNEIHNSPFALRVEPRTLKISREMDVGKAGVKCPCGIAVTPNLTKFALSDASRHCLAVFRCNGELIRTIGEPGTKQGRLSYPDGIAFLNDYELAVADRDNHRVQIFNIITGKFVCTVGKSSRVKKQFKSPWGVSVHKNHLIVSDTYNHRIQVFHSKTFELVKEYSFGQDGASILPSRTVSHNHLLIVADALDSNIHIVDQIDGPVQTIDTKGDGDSIIKSLNGIALGCDGNIAVCDQGDGKVKLFTLEGHLIAKTEGTLSPVDIVSFSDGSYLVLDDKSTKLLVIK